MGFLGLEQQIEGAMCALHRADARPATIMLWHPHAGLPSADSDLPGAATEQFRLNIMLKQRLRRPCLGVARQAAGGGSSNLPSFQPIRQLSGRALAVANVRKNISAGQCDQDHQWQAAAGAMGPAQLHNCVIRCFSLLCLHGCVTLVAACALMDAPGPAGRGRGGGGHQQRRGRRAGPG